MNQQIKLIEWFQFLELPITSLDFINLGYDVAKKEIVHFKNKVKKQRRILSKKYHPDKIKDDGEKMKKINNMIDILLKLKVVPPKPQIIRFNYNFYMNTTGTSTTTSF